MPGIAFAGVRGPNQLVPGVSKNLAANSMTGSGTPPAAALLAGDIVCLTTASALTASSQVVCRMLLAADVSALYQDGSGNVCGILGVCTDSSQFNSSGVATTPPVPGNIATGAGINYPLSNPAMWGQDAATNRSYVGYYPFTSETIFLGRLYTGGGSVTLKHQYDDTLAGLNLSTSSGVTTFTISPSATTKIIRIIGPNEQDPLYNTTVAQNATGPSVFFQVIPAYQQASTGFNYSAQ